MLIAIAGNIGSGKTTLAELLARHLGWDAHFENVGDNPYLNHFYADMNRWAFHVQMYFLDVRLKSIIDIQREARDVVQDRTIYEDAAIFAPNLLDMGLLTQSDYRTYQSLFETVSSLITPPDLVIYLRASISTLVDQIASRNRDYEENIRIDYLKRLNERYDEWFVNYDLGNKLEVDVDKLHFRDDPEHLGVILNRVRGSLYGLFTQ